jgi:hypothetical protein
MAHIPHSVHKRFHKKVCLELRTSLNSEGVTTISPRSVDEVLAGLDANLHTGKPSFLRLRELEASWTDRERFTSGRKKSTV